jgi:hypothetical protein
MDRAAVNAHTSECTPVERSTMEERRQPDASA